MLRPLATLTVFAAFSAAVSGQAPGVLHVKVSVTDAARVSTPVTGHALLISDNPATRSPRRIVTAADGTAKISLPAGNYTVESDEPFAFNGKGYTWTQTLDVPAGRDVVLELTAANAEIGAAPPPPPPSVVRERDESTLRSQWQDSAVSIWTPESRASGYVVDAAGLVVTTEQAIGKASAVDVQLTPSVKVAARVLVADHTRDVAVLWIDSAAAASVRPVPLSCEDTSKPSPIPLDAVCPVLETAEKARQTAEKPAATHLPVEPLQSLPVDVVEAAAQRRVGNLNPYSISSSNFDIAFFTPVLAYAAQRNRSQDSRPGPAAGFGDWSEYFADAPAVLAVRVTPKMAESFWTTVARGAAYTQGAAIPPIKHFKPGFLRLRAFCGDVEVPPIHPFILQQRVSETDAVREGLYVFDAQTLTPQCGTVKLTLYSEKAPEKPDSRVVDPQVLQRIWQDFAPYRALVPAR